MYIYIYIYTYIYIILCVCMCDTRGCIILYTHCCVAPHVLRVFVLAAAMGWLRSVGSIKL